MADSTTWPSVPVCRLVFRLIKLPGFRSCKVADRIVWPTVSIGRPYRLADLCYFWYKTIGWPSVTGGRLCRVADRTSQKADNSYIFFVLKITIMNMLFLNCIATITKYKIQWAKYRDKDTTTETFFFGHIGNISKHFQSCVNVPPF